ncbi:MAG: pyridoxamine 5'-phosphate oxidase family protein [Desulfobacterales bacterium]
MNKEDVFTVIKKNPTFFLGTSENDTPHVRVITLFRADENGLIFATGKHKNLYRQLMGNPRVELLFWLARQDTQIRINGAAEPFEDLETKKLVVEKFTFLKPWIEKEGYDQLAPFCITNAEAYIWSKSAELKQKEYVRL